MKYNKKRALAIQKKYGLSDSTLRDWVHRGIPDKYRGMKYEPPIPASPQQLKRLNKILAQRLFVRSGFDAIPAYRFRDYLRGGGNALLRKEELNAVLQQADELKEILRSYIDQPTQEGMLQLFHEKRIRRSEFFQDKKLYHRLYNNSKATKSELSFLKKKAKLAMKYLKDYP